MDIDTYLDHWEINRIWTHNDRPHHQKRLKTMASYLKGKAFLDAGCAFGHSTIALKELCPGEWTGLVRREGGGSVVHGTGFLGKGNIQG